jgi:hypothetical protein
MKKIIFIILFTIITFSLFSTVTYAIETSPRISDREIVERLTRLEEGQKTLEKRLDDMQMGINKRFDDINKRFDDMNKRFDDRFDDMNKRFDMLMWMIGLFASIVSVTLGFIIKMQWQMNKRLSNVEATIEVQRDEIAFLKGMIERLITPKTL